MTPFEVLTAIAKAEVGTLPVSERPALAEALSVRPARAVLDKARQHRMVMPTLGYGAWAVQEHPTYARALKSRIRDNLSRVFAIQGLYTACRAAAIPILFYKGPALAIQLYGGIDKRDFGDIDCLVHAPDLPRIVAVLQELGYQCERPMETAVEWARFMQKRNEISFSKAGIQGKSSIDLHWRVTNPLYAIPLTTAAIFKAHTEEVALTPQLRIPTFQMAYLPILLAIHHGGNDLWNKLRHLLDWGKLLTHPTADIDWAASLREAQRLDVELLLLTSVSLTHAVLGAPIPAALEAATRAPRVQRLVRKRLATLHRPDNLSADPWQYKLWFRWQTARRWRTRRQFLRRAISVQWQNLQHRLVS